jgi:dolichol-phosphate mannosyltransferase
MKTTEQNKIYAIIPAYNETGKIGRVVHKITAVDLVGEILVIDDCSNDGTAEEARSAGATVISHEINRGVGAAIRTGIDHGRKQGFDIGVVLSGDDQHEPQEIGRVVEPILSGQYDFIQGSRRMRGGRVENDRLFRHVTTQLFSLFFSLVTMTKITDATNGFRAFRLSIFDEPNIDLNQDWLDRYELEPYILYRAAKSRTIRLKEVPITIYYHKDGRSFTKMRPFRDWWRLARPVIYLSLGLRK